MPPHSLRPAFPLAPFVESLEYIQGETVPALERILPAARVHLMVNLDQDEFRTYSGGVVYRTSGAILEGPHSRATVIDTIEQRHLLSVNFSLGGAARFFRIPLSETRDQLVDLDQLWGRDGAVLRERLLEAPDPQARLKIVESVLLRRLLDSQSPDPMIPFAARAFEQGASVSSVTARLGLLPKTFVRRFRGHTGLSPKRYSRVRRLQRLVSSVPQSGADWAALAALHGFTDQAHLIHDFRELTGLTPASYRPRSPHEYNHVPGP